MRLKEEYRRSPNGRRWPLAPRRLCDVARLLAKAGRLRVVEIVRIMERVRKHPTRAQHRENIGQLFPGDRVRTQRVIPRLKNSMSTTPNIFAARSASAWRSLRARSIVLPGSFQSFSLSPSRQKKGRLLRFAIGVLRTARSLLPHATQNRRTER